MEKFNNIYSFVISMDIGIFVAFICSNTIWKHHSWIRPLVSKFGIREGVCVICYDKLKTVYIRFHMYWCLYINTVGNFFAGCILLGTFQCLLNMPVTYLRLGKIFVYSFSEDFCIPGCDAMYPVGM